MWKTNFFLPKLGKNKGIFKNKIKNRTKLILIAFTAYTSPHNNPQTF